jgi:hypothetical protein
MPAAKKSTGSLRCSGELTIRTIRAIHQSLCAELQKHNAVVLDTADASDADLVFVQLVESARLTASRQSKKLTMAAPATGALLDVLKRGGFAGDKSSSMFWLHTNTCGD